MSIPPPIPNQVDQYISQINILQSKVNDIKEQIKQSEKNLNAQIDVSEIKKKSKNDFFFVRIIIYGFILNFDCTF